MSSIFLGDWRVTEGLRQTRLKHDIQRDPEPIASRLRTLLLVRREELEHRRQIRLDDADVATAGHLSVQHVRAGALERRNHGSRAVYVDCGVCVAMNDELGNGLHLVRVGRVALPGEYP